MESITDFINRFFCIYHPSTPPPSYPLVNFSQFSYTLSTGHGHARVRKKGDRHMSKTDKELTAEITVAYIEGWFQRSQTAPLQGNDVCNFIKSVYKTIHSIEEEFK